MINFVDFLFKYRCFNYWTVKRIKLYRDDYILEIYVVHFYSICSRETSTFRDIAPKIITYHNIVDIMVLKVSCPFVNISTCQKKKFQFLYTKELERTVVTRLTENLKDDLRRLKEVVS